MADSVTLTFRGINQSDFLTSSTSVQVNQTIMGVGVVPVSPFVLAAGDVAASGAGVLVGQVYFDSSVTPNVMRVRMS